MASDDAEPRVKVDETTKTLLEKIPVVIALLDEKRQVIFGKDRLLQVAGHTAVTVDGQSAPGDVLHCTNALSAPGGCGTSEACALCGANRAINQSMRQGETVSQACRIRYENEGVNDLDLTVTATPYTSAGKNYTMLTIQDASDERRRRALERVFFHDIMNVAGGIAGLAEVLRDAESQEEVNSMLGIMETSAKSLLDEIDAQRQLASAESGDLTVQNSAVGAMDLVNEVANTMSFHAVAEARSITVDGRSDDFTVVTDPTLLRRVLINLSKNALEATPAFGSVTIGAFAEAGRARFRVSNPGVIPRDVQLQLFQRSFSTKGRDRGIGTYSVRVLTEQYLEGTVSFVSNESVQTIFTVDLPLEA